MKEPDTFSSLFRPNPANSGVYYIYDVGYKGTEHRVYQILAVSAEETSPPPPCGWHMTCLLAGTRKEPAVRCVLFLGFYVLIIDIFHKHFEVKEFVGSMPNIFKTHIL